MRYSHLGVHGLARTRIGSSVLFRTFGTPRVRYHGRVGLTGAIRSAGDARDIPLTPELERVIKLRQNLLALEQEREAASKLAQVCSVRSKRLLARILSLNDYALERTRAGDEAAARRCIKVKLQVRDTLDKNINRAQNNYALASRLDKIIGNQQLELAQLITQSGYDEGQWMAAAQQLKQRGSEERVGGDETQLGPASSEAAQQLKQRGSEERVGGDETQLGPASPEAAQHLNQGGSEERVGGDETQLGPASSNDPEESTPNSYELESTPEPTPNTSEDLEGSPPDSSEDAEGPKSLGRAKSIRALPGPQYPDLWDAPTKTTSHAEPNKLQDLGRSSQGSGRSQQDLGKSQQDPGRSSTPIVRFQNGLDVKGGPVEGCEETEGPESMGSQDSGTRGAPDNELQMSDVPPVLEDNHSGTVGINSAAAAANLSTQGELASSCLSDPSASGWSSQTVTSMDEIELAAASPDADLLIALDSALTHGNEEDRCTSDTDFEDVSVIGSIGRDEVEGEGEGADDDAPAPPLDIDCRGYEKLGMPETANKSDVAVMPQTAGSSVAVDASASPACSAVSASTADAVDGASGTVSASTADAVDGASGTVSATTADAVDGARGTVSASTADAVDGASDTVSASTADAVDGASDTVSASTADAVDGESTPDVSSAAEADVASDIDSPDAATATTAAHATIPSAVSDIASDLDSPDVASAATAAVAITLSAVSDVVPDLGSIGASAASDATDADADADADADGLSLLPLLEEVKTRLSDAAPGSGNMQPPDSLDEVLLKLRNAVRDMKEG